MARKPTTKSTLKTWELCQDWGTGVRVRCPHCGGRLDVEGDRVRYGEPHTASCFYCYKTSWLPKVVTGQEDQDESGTDGRDAGHAAVG